MDSAKKLITFLICLLVAGCGNEMLALKNLDSTKGMGQQCSPNQPIDGPFTKQNRKVILNNVHVMKKMTAQSANLPDGMEVAITIDHNCLKEGHGGEISQQYNREVAPPTYTYYLELNRSEKYQEFQAAVDEDPCVLYVSDTTVVRPNAATNDPSLGSQDHLQAINAYSAWDTVNSSSIGVTRDVVVAIIDSGVDPNHEDLRENMWSNPGEVANNGRDDDGNGYIDDSFGYNFANNNGNAGPADSSTNNAHGTHVAGLTGARGDNGRGGSGVLGHHVKIMSLNVFGSSSGAFTVNIDNAIRYAADNGADVINMSLGGCGYSASTDQALSYAISRGVTIIVAAGNNGAEISSNPADSNCGGFGRFFDTPASFGSKYSGMITVASTDSLRNNAMSSFSNYSSSVVEMAAPGSADTARGLGLYSTLTGSRYGRMMGTSMASPVVAGAAAVAIGLMRSRGVSHTNTGIENILRNTASKLSSLSSRVRNGNHLSLSNLVNEINKSFPADGSNPNPDIPDPDQPDPDWPDPNEPGPPLPPWPGDDNDDSDPPDSGQPDPDWPDPTQPGPPLPPWPGDSAESPPSCH